MTDANSGGGWDVHSYLQEWGRKVPVSVSNVFTYLGRQEATVQLILLLNLQLSSIMCLWERREGQNMFYCFSPKVTLWSTVLHPFITPTTHPDPAILICSTAVEKNFLISLSIPKITLRTSVSYFWDHKSFSIQNFSQSCIQSRWSKRNTHQTEKQKAEFSPG